MRGLTMNSLYQQLHQCNSNNFMGILKSAKNPQALLMNMAQQNPNIRQILNEVQANNGDARGLFYRKAKEMGVNPDDVLSQLINK